MPVVKKVLNTSVVLICTPEGKEQILLQKGVGYGRRPGDTIELLDSGQLFVPFAPESRQNTLQMLQDVPAELAELSHRIIQYAEASLGSKLNPHIFLALTDHLNFAMERQKKGLVITNRVLWEIKTFYKKEYQIGQYALSLIEKELGTALPEEEAANIAFHIINAQNEEAQSDAIRDAKLIGKLVMLISYTMKYKPDRESFHFARFLSHLQYFFQRFFSGSMLVSEDDFLYHQVEIGYPKAMACAEKIRTLLLKEYGICITNEEVAYLAVHIQRLIQKDS